MSVVFQERLLVVWGEGGAVSCVRVCSKGYFFEEILSMELYLFKKRLIVKHVSVLVIFEGKR